MAIFVCLHCGEVIEFLGDAPREPECDCGAVMEPEATLADADRRAACLLSAKTFAACGG